MRTRDLTLQPPFAPAALPQLGPSCEFVSFVDRNAIASAVCQDTWLLCHANANKGLNPTTAIRARGPAATGCLAIHEHRLPILPMSPNHADRTAALPAQPCRSLYPSTVRISQRTAFCVRLRSSQIVSDRLGSSEIVRAHRRPPPAIPAELPKCSPDSACQTGKKARHFASIRVTSRQDAHEKKDSPRHLGVVDTSKYWSTYLGIYSMHPFSANFGSPVSLRADRRASRSRHLCQSQESDELYFRQMSTSTRNSKLKTQNSKPTRHPLPKEKNTATFRDIWGHLGTFGDICPTFTPITKEPRSREKKDPDGRNVR